MKHQLCNGHKVSGYRWNWILLKFPVHLWSVENWSYFLHSLIIIVMNSKNARRRRLWTEAPIEFCAIRSSQSQLLVHSSCPPPRRVFQLVSYSVDPKECINPSAGSSVGRTDGWIASQPASEGFELKKSNGTSTSVTRNGFPWATVAELTAIHLFCMYRVREMHLSLSTSGATALALHTINSGIVPLQLLSK